jgi:hypothetical protein
VCIDALIRGFDRDSPHSQRRSEQWSTASAVSRAYGAPALLLAVSGLEVQRHSALRRQRLEDLTMQ